MSSTIFEILSLAWAIKQTCDDASSAKKLLKPVGCEMSSAMEVLLKSKKEAPTDDSRKLLSRLKEIMTDLKSTVEKVASMNKIIFLLKVAHLLKDIENKLHLFHVHMHTLTNMMLADDVSFSLQDFAHCQKELREAVQDEIEEVKTFREAGHGDLKDFIAMKYTPEEIRETIDELKKVRDDLESKKNALLHADENGSRSKEEQELNHTYQIISLLSMASLDEQKQYLAYHKQKSPHLYLPSSCYCPVTFQLLIDPVIVDAECSHTLSREWMQKWMRQKKLRCPVCNSALRSYIVRPNIQLRGAIEFLISNKFSSETSLATFIDKEDQDTVSSTSKSSNVSSEKILKSDIFSTMKNNITSIKRKSMPASQAPVKPLPILSQTFFSSLPSLLPNLPTVPSLQPNPPPKLPKLPQSNINLLMALLPLEYDETEATRALVFLREAAADEANCVGISAVGGIPAIVRCMQKHMTSVVIQEESCAVLKTLACNHAGIRTAITAAGGKNAALVAKATHSGNRRVKRQADALLSTLKS